MCFGVWFLQYILRIQTLLGCVFLKLFLQFFLITLLWLFEQNVSKHRRTINKKCVLKQHSHSETIFQNSSQTFVDFWVILDAFGGLGEAHGGHFWRFWGLKKGTKFWADFWEDFWEGSAGTAVAARGHLGRMFGMPWHGKERSARPGPEGGRIVYASRIPPTPWIDCLEKSGTFK